VVRLNIDSGTPGEEVLAYDPIAVHLAMDGAVLEEVVAEGVLSSPSGILVSPRFLVVTDNASSTIHWFDHAGASLGSLDTGLPAGSLSGIAAGPDGKLYLSDLQTGTAYRVEPR
jgi:glucose/arabinose dehydrogenase